MDKMYVEQYGRLENSHWWFVVRQKIILQALRKFIPSDKTGRLKILNVGAAAGGSSKWLSALGDVVSLDNDPLFLSYLASQHLTVINASVTDIPLDDNSFDLVCAFDVIEHVKNDQRAVEELVRVCKPGGNICITVPAFQSLWANHDEVNRHQRRYITRQLQNLFSSQPVAVQYSSYFNSILFVPVFLFRKMHLLFKNNKQPNNSDFIYLRKNIFLNNILKNLFMAELFLLKWVKFPFGVSLIMVMRKHPVPDDRL